ncbi:MAG: hypothetical protein IAE97_04680 [Chthoniobacterales bacterium]|nr:hypothetical protein [Chthoniobacterales bacterium]
MAIPEPRRGVWAVKMNFGGWVLSGLLLGSVNLPAQDVPLGAPDEFAHLFGYPVGRLVVRDITEDSRKSLGDAIVSAHEYISSDDTFAKTHVVVAKSGFQPIEQFREKLSSILDGSVRNSEAASIIKRVNGKNGIEGLAGLVGSGPDGQVWCAIASVPSKKLDILISIGASVPPLVEVPETSEYFRNVFHGRGFMMDRLSKTLQIAAERIDSEK